MRTLLPVLFLMSAGLAAEKAPADELAKLDARELHNRGTRRLAEGDLAGAEEALRASLGKDVDALRPPALHNLGHVRFGKGKAVLGGKTAGDVTELSIARSYLEAADADISDMKDQIELLDKAKAEGREPDYVPATTALGGGIWWVTRKEPAKIVTQPVLVDPAVVVPEAPSSIDIVKTYREAHEAVASRDFEKATQQFIQLSENPSVQEPTRTWAGVEAVLTTYLNGKSADARERAQAASEHAASIPEESAHVGNYLVRMLGEVVKLPAIPGKSLDSSRSDASHIMGWMLAGLKDWEQGMPDEAAIYLSAVTSAQLKGNDQWIKVYQDLARDYLADRQLLAGPVFGKFPSDKAGCEAAVVELDTVLKSLKTRGRARYNVRAWQLDLTRKARLLDAPKEEIAKTTAAAAPTTDPAAVMARLSAYAGEFQFLDAARYLKSLPADPLGAKRVSLIAVAESSTVFLADIEEDLRKGAVSAELPMKSGDVMQKIAIDPDGKIVTTDSAGKTAIRSWNEFSPDALIALHRILVKNPKSELERLRRHQCAIAFDWLAGNRERALTAAALLGQGSAGFKQQWELIAGGLPK